MTGKPTEKKETFLELIHRMLNGKLPKRYEVLLDEKTFRDDKLDLSALYPYADPDKCVINFSGLPSHLFEVGRLTARFQAFVGKAPSTIQGYMNRLTQFFEALEKHNDILDYRFLTMDDIITTIKRNRWPAETARKICVALDKLYSMASSIYDKSMLRVDLNDLAVLRSHFSKAADSNRSTGKTPDIDPDFFEELDERLEAIAEAPGIPINYRMTAAFLLLKMWLGLRACEPFSLTIHSMYTKKSVSGREDSYIKYIPFKLTGGGQRLLYATTCILPRAQYAFNLLLRLRKQVPGYKRTDKLYILDGEGKPEGRYKYYVERLYQNHLADLTGRKWSEVKSHLVDGKTIYYPNETQYRVHLCSWLYHHGVSLPVIEIGMSHLIDAMHAYYVRTKDKTFKSEQRRADNIIRTRMNNDFDTSEQPEHGEELLSGLLLAVSRYKTYVGIHKEMTDKGYEYEVSHYEELIRGAVNGEIEPAIGYLEDAIEREGREAVLSRHPELHNIVSQTKQLRKEFLKWQQSRSK